MKPLAGRGSCHVISSVYASMLAGAASYQLYYVEKQGDDREHKQ